jgi:hypothetical protein
VEIVMAYAISAGSAHTGVATTPQYTGGSLSDHLYHLESAPGNLGEVALVGAVFAAGAAEFYRRFRAN